MRYPLVLQHSQEDCGAACLASVARCHGRIFSLNRARETVGTGQLGTTLLGLRRGAEALGLHGRSAVASLQLLERMEDLPLPAILHWQGRHWVVLYGKQGKNFVIGDPAQGMRRLTAEELKAGWVDGVLLLLQPDGERFYRQANDRAEGLGAIFRGLLPYRWLLLETFCCVSLIGLLALAAPFFIQVLTDDVLLQGDRRLLISIVVAVVIMYLIRWGLAIVAKLLISYCAQRLELGLVLTFSQQLLRLPLTYYENRRSGEVVSRLRDIEEINRLVTQVVISLPSTFLIAGVSLGVMVVYSRGLTLVVLGFAGIMVVPTLLLQPLLRRHTQRAMALETETQGVLVETFKGALTLKTTGAAPLLWDEVQSRAGRLAHLRLQATHVGIINTTFGGLVADIGNAALLGLGSLLVLRQELSIGQLLAFSTLSRNVTWLVDDVIEFVNDYVRATTANSRLQEVVSAAPESRRDETPKAWVTLDRDSDLHCEHITFYYPGRTGLLQDLSLTIPGGKTTALIGPSGCGKSTLAKVLAGLYSPQGGNVRLGNYNLQDLALDCVRSQIVMVPQDAHFWSRPILENFRLGSPHLDFEAVVKACQITGADDFIRHLPDKYHTILGEFGANLSGGQRQRLAVARAIVHHPPILMLDESTASLDPTSEMELIDKLVWQRQGQTTLLISHRPRVITQADWVVYLEEGKVLLEGSPADLQAQAGKHLDFLTP